MKNKITKRRRTKRYVVEDIMDDRLVKVHDFNLHKYIKVKEYLVKWLGYKRRSWEPIENLKNCPLILDKYLKNKKDSENLLNNNKKKENEVNNKNADNIKNDIISQLIKISEIQTSNFSYKNFGPCFKDVIDINALITPEK